MSNLSTLGKYLTLICLGPLLRIELTQAGRDLLAELDDNGSDVESFYELFGEFLTNGWDSLRAEEIGALTDCPFILSPDAERDDHGELVQAESVYWFEAYQVRSIIDDLLTGGAKLRKA